MIKVNINECSYHLAQDWREVTFGQYINILDAKKTKNILPIQRTIKLICAVSNSPAQLEKKILKIDLEKYNQIVEAMKWLDQEVPLESVEQKKTLDIEGKQYKLKEGKDTNILEQITLDTYTNEGKIDPFELAFGVLLREVDEHGAEKEFDPDTFTEVIKHLKDKVNLMEVYQHIAFFLSGSNQSITNPSDTFSITRC